MARPRKATVDYFPHETEHGPTLFILQNRWGNDGFAAWYKILERLGATDGHFLDCRNKGIWHHLQAYTMVNEQVLNEILDTLADLESIDKSLWSYRVIYSQNFVDGIKDAYRRREDNLPTRGKVFAITNVQDKEFLTAETLPKEVYPVRSTERERERERETKEKLQQRLTPEEVKEHYLRYAGVLQVAGGQMPIFVDLSSKYPADIIVEAFQAGNAGGKRGPGYLNWCMARMKGKVDEPSQGDDFDAMIERLNAGLEETK